MNLLFITARPTYPENSGARRRMFNLIKNLSNEHNITLISFISNDSQYNSMQHMQQIVDDVNCVYRPHSPESNTIQKIIKFFTGQPYYTSDFSCNRMKVVIKNIVSNNQFDLVHFDFMEMGQYHDLVKNIPTILTEHDIYYIKLFRYLKNISNLQEIIGTIRDFFKIYFYEKKIWQKFPVVITTSDHDAEIIKKRTSSPDVKVVPNGVDTEYFVSDTYPSPVEKSIIYCGSMSGRANIDAVMYFYTKIFGRVKNNIPDIKWYIVGKNPPKKVRELDQKESIIVTGKVEDIRPYISQAQLYIVPLKIGSGTRLKILEGMAMGKPVISTSIGCEGLKVEDGKNIIICDNPNLFAHKIIELLNQRKYRQKIAREGRKLTEEYYDWKICSNKFNRIIKDTIINYR